MNTYNCYYGCTCIEVKASTSLAAQTEAAKRFKLKPKHAYKVSVVLAAKENGVPVVHAPQHIAP